VEGAKPKQPVLPSVRCEAELRRRLVAGEFGPGDTQLPGMDDLAEELGCSRGTVATILRKLADEGLVTIIRGYGTFVAPLPLPAGGLPGLGCQGHRRISPPLLIDLLRRALPLMSP